MSDALVTPAQITSALAGDNGPAIDALLAALSPLFRQLATRHAATNNAGSSSDLEQDARIAAWQGLGRFDAERFTDETLADGFQGFIYSSVDHALRDAVREARFGDCPGADTDAMKTFGRMVEQSDGDLYLAEQMCRHVPATNRRLSQDRARAARMAWQGTVRLDAPAGENGITLAELMASELGEEADLIPRDLLSPEDISRAQSRTRVPVIRAVLDSMGAGQANVLRADYGINSPEFPDDASMAEALNTTPSALAKCRSNGKRTFAARFITAYGLRGAEADAWAAAAVAELAKTAKSRDGRKAYAAAHAMG